MRELPMAPDAGRARGAADARAERAVAACPIARCERCGYVFPPNVVTSVCPRCLEPFSRDSCFGSCWSCPLTR